MPALTAAMTFTRHRYFQAFRRITRKRLLPSADAMPSYYAIIFKTADMSRCQQRLSAMRISFYRYRAPLIVNMT